MHIPKNHKYKREKKVSEMCKNQLYLNNLKIIKTYLSGLIGLQGSNHFKKRQCAKDLPLGWCGKSLKILYFKNLKSFFKKM